MRLLVVTLIFSSVCCLSASAKNNFATTSTAAQTRVERILIKGNRHIKRATILSWIGTRSGGNYDPAQIDRDVRALTKTNRFQNVKVETSESRRGGKIVMFEFKEKAK